MKKIYFQLSNHPYDMRVDDAPNFDPKKEFRWQKFTCGFESAAELFNFIDFLKQVEENSKISLVNFIEITAFDDDGNQINDPVDHDLIDWEIIELVDSLHDVAKSKRSED